MKYIKKYKLFENIYVDNCYNDIFAKIDDLDYVKNCLNNEDFDVNHKYNPSNANDGYTMLYWAGFYKKIDIFKLFVENGADINTIFDDKTIVIGIISKYHYNALTNVDKSIIEICFQHNINLNHKYKGKDFFDYLDGINKTFKKFLIKKYPEQYQKYLKLKSVSDFNL